MLYVFNCYTYCLNRRLQTFRLPTWIPNPLLLEVTLKHSHASAEEVEGGGGEGWGKRAAAKTTVKKQEELKRQRLSQGRVMCTLLGG